MQLIRLLIVFTVLLFLPYWGAAQDWSHFSFEELDSTFKNLENNSQKAEKINLAKYIFRRASDEGLDSLAIAFKWELADMYSRYGRYQESNKLFEACSDYYRQQDGDTANYHLQALSRIASNYSNSGDYEKAEAMFKQLLLIRSEQRPKYLRKYAIITNNLASLYVKIGNFEEAEPLFIKTKKLFRQIFGNKSLQYAIAVNNLGTLYAQLNQLERATDMLEQTKTTFELIKGKESFYYAETANNLAMTYFELGHKEKGEVLIKEALAIKKRIFGPKHPKYALSLANLGSFYNKVGEWGKAIELLEESLSIRKETLGETHSEYAQNLADLALSNFKKGDYNKAERLYKKALDSYGESVQKKHPYYLLVIYNLANLYRLQGKDNKVLEHINLLLRYNCKNHDFGSQPPLQDLLSLADYEYYSVRYLIGVLEEYYHIQYQKYQSTKDKDALLLAYQAMKVALAVNERQRSRFLDDGDKLFLLKKTSMYVDYILWVGDILQEENIDKKVIGETFGFAELNKSILLAESIKGTKVRKLSNLPAAIAKREEELLRKKKELQKKEIEAQNDSIKITIKDQLVNLEISINDFLDTIKQQFPKYHALKYKNITTSVEEVQAQLADKTLLIEFFVAKNATYVFTIAKTEVELFKIDLSRNRLQQRVDSFRNVLTNYGLLLDSPKESYKQYTQNAYWFFDQLLRKPLEGKDADRMVVITDNVLGHIPFEALLTQEVSANKSYQDLPYLLNKYIINYNYSATLWKENKLAPSFNNNEKILALAATYNQKKGLSKLRTPYTVNLRNKLLPLPSTIEEVKGLSQKFQGEFLNGNAANEAYFKQHAEKFGVIHLAMHGLLNTRVPLLSSLALTENLDSLEDNFLKAYEIAHLNLNADLVVLSACETGYGKFEQGEGVMSLARSFMYAGAPSLVVSLWQVNDHATSRIMDFFYANLALGLPKDEALCKAKKEYILKAKGNALHPAFWSAFVQLGDNRPVQLKEQQNILLWVVGGSIFLLFAIFISIVWYQRK